MKSEIEEYQKKKNILLVLYSVPIIVAIISLGSEIFLQSTFKIISLESGNSYSTAYTLGLLYGLPCLLKIATSYTYSEEIVFYISAIINILIALVNIILSSYCFKEKNTTKNIIAFLVIYACDFICALFAIGFSAASFFTYNLQVYDIVLQIILHLLFLFIIAYSLYLNMKVDRLKKSIENYDE